MAIQGAAPKKARTFRRPKQDADYVEMTLADTWREYDRRARQFFGMSCDEFEAALARGDFEGREEDTGFLRTLMMRPDEKL